MSDKFQEKTVNDRASSLDSMIKGVYILAITAEKLEAENLLPIVHMAEAMLRKKDATFVAMMEKA